MAKAGQKQQGRGGLTAVVLALALAGCAAGPAGTGTGEGKVNSGRGKVTAKPGTTNPGTAASNKPSTGLGAEKPGVDPRASDDPSLVKPSAPPSATASADAKASSVVASSDPNASPTTPPSTTANPESEDPNGPLKRVAEAWSARVLAGGRHGTPADGSGVAANLGQNMNQAVGMVGLPPSNPSRLYFTDPRANQLRSLNVPAEANASGTVRLELGDPDREADGGPAGVRGLIAPTGLAADSQGRLLLAEFSGNRLWRYDPASYSAPTQAQVQNATELAGSGIRNTSPASYADGAGNLAKLHSITSLAADGDTLYLSDAGFFGLRQAATGDAACPIDFVAGPKAALTNQSNPAPAAPTSTSRAEAIFVGAKGMAVGTMAAGASGTAALLAGKKVLFIAEAGRNCIRAVDLSSPNGLVYTVAGTSSAGHTDGPLATATFSEPYALALDSNGALYVGEKGPGSHRLRVVDFISERVITLLGEANEGATIRPPDANLPRGIVEFGHILGICVVNGQDASTTPRKLYVYDSGATADLVNPEENAAKAGPRIMELAPQK